MNWSNVKLILVREIRDQLRDRRTLFMIAVLPLLLYPLLGMSFFQVMQFMREHAIRVLVVGAPQIRGPAAVDCRQTSSPGACLPSRKTLACCAVAQQKDASAEHQAEQSPLERARQEMQAGDYDVVVYFPPDFDERFERLQQSLARARKSVQEPPPASHDARASTIYPNLAKDASKAAYRRVSDVLDDGARRSAEHNLEANQLPPAAARPFEITTVDVAEEGQRKAALWSKILPFVLLIWALTGAFYPAIDLCAGEKERGTLETLLSSPAERIEIVWGKLLTVMLFSMATAILNLASMGITGSFMLSQLHCPTSARRQAWPWCGCWWRWCRCRRCSARCAWRWPRSPAAPRKGSTT